MQVLIPSPTLGTLSPGLFVAAIAGVVVLTTSQRTIDFESSGNVETLRSLYHALSAPPQITESRHSLRLKGVGATRYHAQLNSLVQRLGKIS